MQTILITGGTGLVGRALTEMLLNKGYKVIILSRNSQRNVPTENLQYALWDVKKGYIDHDALLEADYIVHLAGAGVVDRKWTTAYKREILESRTKSSKLIADSLQQLSHHVKAIISSSAIGWYGPDLEEGKAFTENDAASNDFLGETCRLWEESIEAAAKSGVRICKLRTGIVLSNDGGALPVLKMPIQFGVAAIMGNGKQNMSWIHIEDLCRMFLFAIENNQLEGSYNAVAPTPVSNKKFTLTLAKAIKGNFFTGIHVPAFALRLLKGERSIEVLKSATVSCEKIKKAGFTFIYPSIEAAVNQLVKKKS